MEQIEKKKKQLQQENDIITDIFFEYRLYDNSDIDTNAQKISLVNKLFGGKIKYNSFAKSVNKKLVNLSQRTSLSVEELIKEARDSKLARLHFSFDAGKQCAHERIQDDNIKEQISRVFNEKKYKSFGRKYLNNEISGKFVVNSEGSVISIKSEKQNSMTNSKMFDRRLIVTSGDKSYNIFLINKYTKEEGGMQNNTLREVQQTYKYCKKNNQDNIYFVFILDGDYYNSVETGINETKHIKVCENYHFDETLKEIINNF